jgi:hypothetical protein
VRIKKAKLSPMNKVTIMYEQKSTTGAWDDYSFTCSEKPRLEFNQALEALAPHVVEMCELPDSYLNRIEVRGVSFSYGGDKEVMGATISASMKLDKSNQNLNLNTPHKASDSYNEYPADPKQLLSDGCVDALDEFISEVSAYIRGERAQGKLFNVA